MKKVIYGVSILVGTIIGVGLFALPYVTMKAGIWVVLGYFVLLGTMAILVNYIFSELAIHTPDFKRLPGFAKIYLGEKGRKVALISGILGLTGVALAYIILGGEFLYQLLGESLGGSARFYGLLYFVAGAIVILLGIKTTSSVSFWGVILFFLILILGFVRGFPYLEISNLWTNKINVPDIFLPYGVILFSLSGTALIPEIEEFLGEDKHLLKKIILPGILIPAIIYLLFIFLILGITGNQTTEFAIDGLGDFLGNGVVSLMFLFGLVTTFTSFIVLGLTLKKIFWFDLNIPKNWAWFLACFPALFLYLLGFQDFIQIIGFLGAVMFATDSILINLMYRKLGLTKPEAICKFKRFLVYPLIFVFLLGILYEVYYFFNNL